MSHTHFKAFKSCWLKDLYSSLVRHATARVIAAIAEIEIPVGQWPTLFPALLQAATSTVVAQRETGAFALCTILEKTGLEMQDQLPDFFKLFSGLAHDNDSLEVRVISVRLVGKFVLFSFSYTSQSAWCVC